MKTETAVAILGDGGGTCKDDKKKIFRDAATIPNQHQQPPPPAAAAAVAHHPPPIMSLVAGPNGQVYLVPAQPAPQQHHHHQQPPIAAPFFVTNDHSAAAARAMGPTNICWPAHAQQYHATPPAGQAAPPTTIYLSGPQFITSATSQLQLQPAQHVPIQQTSTSAAAAPVNPNNYSSSLSWPSTPPNSTSPECPPGAELLNCIVGGSSSGRGGSDYNLSSLPTPEPSEAPLLDLPKRLLQQQQQQQQDAVTATMRTEFQTQQHQQQPPFCNWEDIDIVQETTTNSSSSLSGNMSSSSLGRITGDIVASALAASDVIPAQQLVQQLSFPAAAVAAAAASTADVIPTDRPVDPMAKQLQCGKCGRKFKYKQFLEIHQRDCMKAVKC